MRGDAILVAGSPGTGKTVLGLHFLHEGATRFGEKGVYVTFEQLPQQIYRDGANLGWDLQKLEEQDGLRVICTSPDVLLRAADSSHVLDGPLKEMDAQRIVIDPITYLSMFLPEYEVRKEAYRLINYLKAKGLTSLLIHEVPDVVGGSLRISDSGFGFLVDSILLLRYVEIASSIRRALVVLKMRGSDHDKRLREYQITPQGMKVVAGFEQYENILSGAARKTAAESLVKAFKGV